MSYFPEPYTHRKSKITVILDQSNYATKSDLKNVAGVHTLEFSKKTELANLQSEVNKFDIDKLAELGGDK